jgi:hypothetical protein
VPFSFPRAALLPGLLLLALLLVTPNRQPQAGLAFLSLASVYGIVLALQRLCASNLYVAPEIRMLYGDFYSSVACGLTYGDTYLSIAYGLTAVWLLLPYSRGHSRTAVFLGVLVVGSLASGVAFFCGKGGDSPVGTAPAVMVIGSHFLLFASGLSLAAYGCRKRSGHGRFLVLLGAWLLLACVILAGAAKGLSAGMPPDLVWVTLGFVGVAGLVLLPFVVLAWLNPFYRQRFEAAFQLSTRAV